MSENRESYRRIREEYQTKYLRSREEATRRRLEVEEKVPGVRELNARMGDVGLAVMKVALNSEPEQTAAALEEMRRENKELNARRQALLVAAGYPADYPEVHYECPLCSDSGYVNTKMCRCLRTKLIEAGYEESGLMALPVGETFETFSLDYYKDNADALRCARQAYGCMYQFAEQFSTEAPRGPERFLALFGGTGLGKTHLSSAVARALIAKGFDVLYVSAGGLFADFETVRFGGGSGLAAGQKLDRYFESDLLIIDDLGTEMVNQFTTSCLYQVINTRLNRNRAMILSTNLSGEDFRKKYWDRITSRVLGEFTYLPLIGRDIRQQKIQKAKR